MRYIVLGADPKPEPPPSVKHSGITVQARDWEDLMPIPKQDGILKDLVETLGELGIGPFLWNKQNKSSLILDLNQVGKAGRVLNAICDQLGVRSTFRCFEAEPNEDGGDTWASTSEPFRRDDSRKLSSCRASPDRKGGVSLFRLYIRLQGQSDKRSQVLS